ncbi:hypothetical protein ANTPLA_LOCUS8272 [Anthophora plagiata]
MLRMRISRYSRARKDVFEKIFNSHKMKQKEKRIKETMESWLSDVQRVRIPRPKFGSGNSVRRSNSTVQHVRPEVLSRQTQDVVKATEELRQALQDKL